MPPIDLSIAAGRQTATETLTRFKAETIPTDDRRAVAPRVDAPASMRNAERPASQADEVRKILGMTNALASNIVDLKEAQFAKAEEQNALIAARDTATGNVNRDVYDRSKAYRMVIADGRVHKRIADAVPTITQDITAYINQHADADPTKGEMPVTLEDVNARFDEHVKSLLLDPDGNPIDYGDPQANATLYRSIQQLRIQTMQNAADLIKQQEQDKAMTSISSIAMGELGQGKASAVEDAIHKAAALGISPQVAKKSLLHTVLDQALQSKDESVIQGALTSLQADGKTPTWDAQERGTLLTSYSTLHSQFEAERIRDAERKSAENTGTMLPDIMAGKLRVTPDSMRALMAKGPANGGITPRDAEHLMSLQNTVDSKRLQEENAARSRVTYAWEAQNHAWAVQSRNYELANRRAQESFTAIQAKFFSGSMSQPQAIAGLDAQYKRGELDDKTYTASRVFFMQMPSPTKLVSQHDGEQYLFSLQAELKRMGDMSARRAKGYWPPEVWGNARNEATTSFYRTLYSTGDPQASLTAALKSVRLNDRYVKSVVEGASARTPKLTTAQKLQLQSLGAEAPK